MTFILRNDHRQNHVAMTTTNKTGISLKLSPKTGPGKPNVNTAQQHEEIAQTLTAEIFSQIKCGLVMCGGKGKKQHVHKTTQNT